jgi:hypothetical protein
MIAVIGRFASYREIRSKVMKMPFTTEEFLHVFQRYNETVWPLQVMFFGVAVYVVLSIFRKGQYTNIIAFSFLAFLWIWMGVLYHLVFFSQINKAANVFGVVFILQGFLFLYFGAYRQMIKLEVRHEVSGVLGTIILLYALILYPIAGLFLGHVYPLSPTFGAPCPTVIFTFGILLFSQYRLPWYLVIVPFLWSLIGLSAAITLSMPEDFGLVAAGVVSTFDVLFLKPQQRITTGLA